MMKLGFNEATCLRNSSLEKDLVLAERFGYDYIEIRLDMLQTWLQEHTLVELADIFSVSHLKPWGYNSLEDITFCDAGRWSEIRQQLVLACYAGEVVGGDCLVVVPTIREGAHFSDRDTVRDSVKRLREMSALAAESQMRLAFEPIGSAGCCVRSLAMAMEIVDAVDRSNVGLAIDAFNLYLYDQWQDLSTLRQVPVEKIFVYHIDDADRLPVAVLDHCHRLFPGNGAIPLYMITHELVKKVIQGSVHWSCLTQVTGKWQPARSLLSERKKRDLS